MNQINDRFSFDNIFKELLEKGFSHQDALDYILETFSLSALVFQERVENKFYLEINLEDKISPDLLELKKQIFSTHYPNKN